jgi:integrase/recombinase XerD
MKKRVHSASCISVLAGEYLEGLKARRYSPRSIEIYGRAITDMIASIGKPDARLVTPGDFDAYRAQLLGRGFRSASVAVYVRANRLFFRHLEEGQRIFENPAAALPPVRATRPLQPVPSEEEMRILLAQPDVGTRAGIRDRAILETIYSTGLRRQEMASLRVDSVNLKEGMVRVMGKG